MRRGSASSVCCWPDQLAVCVSRGCGTSQQRAVGRQAPLYTPILPLHPRAVIPPARPAEECARPDADLTPKKDAAFPRSLFFSTLHAGGVSHSDDTIEGDVNKRV